MRERAEREAVRLQAAELFADGLSPREVASRLRVTPKSAYLWRRRWQTMGVAGLVSKGPGGSTCRLSAEQLERLGRELDAGPAAHGWGEDQRWTLARVTELVLRLFRVRYTPRGMAYVLHRIGFSPQVPKHRACRRDDEAIETWVREVWPQVKPPRRPRTPGSSSKTKPARA